MTVQLSGGLRGPHLYVNENKAPRNHAENKKFQPLKHFLSADPFLAPGHLPYIKFCIQCCGVYLNFWHEPFTILLQDLRIANYKNGHHSNSSLSPPILK